MKDLEMLMTNVVVCDKHVARLNVAIAGTKQLFPISVGVIEELPLTDFAMLNMVGTRFAALQGTIGKKIFPLIIKLFLGDNPCNKKFTDIVTTMKEIGALESKELWDRFREIRNWIINDDIDRPEFMGLNLCASTSHDLISYWQFLKKFIEDKVLVRYKTEAL